MSTTLNTTGLRKGIVQSTLWSMPLLPLFFPLTAEATLPPRAMALIGNLYTVILNPIIIFMFAAAFLYFMYGVLKMVWFGDSEDERANGRRAMLWGIIGMFIMFSVFAIMRIIVNSIGGNATTAFQSV